MNSDNLDQQADALEQSQENEDPGLKRIANSMRTEARASREEDQKQQAEEAEEERDRLNQERYKDFE